MVIYDYYVVDNMVTSKVDCDLIGNVLFQFNFNRSIIYFLFFIKIPPPLFFFVGFTVSSFT